ncbi:12301_t:CDS:2, partial [Cetraspora pellucida]
ILNKYNLSAESNLLQLCAHANKLRALVPNNKKKRLIIKERAQYCAKTKDMWNIWLHALDLAIPKNNTDEAIMAASSCVSQFRRELAEAEEKLRRIQNINTTKISTIQDLADVIMMLKEAKNNSEHWQFLFMEKNPECAKELLTWIQDAIATRKLCNPVYSINRKCTTGIFNKFLKLYDITAKRLKKIEGKHASRVHDSQNPTLQRFEFLSKVAMRHKIDHHNSGIYYAE